MNKSPTTKLLIYGNFSSTNNLLSSISIFGVIPYVYLTIQVFFIRPDFIKANAIEIFSMYLLFSWSWLGPFAIWVYEDKIIPKFFNEAKSIFLNKNEYDNFLAIFNSSLYTNYKTHIIIWQSLIFIAFLLISGYMKRFGLHGLSDYLYWFWIIFLMYLGFITGQGVGGVLRTIKIIDQLSKIQFNINQYHHDRHGGLSCIGKLTIWTLSLFSLGSICVPILCCVIYFSDPIVTVPIFIMLFLYCFFIVISFIYPLIKIHGRVSEIKDLLFNEIRNQTASLGYLQPECLFYDCDLTKHMQILNFRNMLVDLDRIASYPINTKIVFEVILFGFLPVILLFAQYLLLSK
jgi:hypothetical protein